MTETEALRLGRRGLWAGGAGLLTSVALGVALVAASWSNYRGARAAYETLNRGQVEILQHALRGALGGRAEGVDSLELQAAVEANREAGLRYLALLQPDGTVAVDAGEPIAPVQVPASFLERVMETGIVMIRVEDRVRAFLPRPVREPGRGNFRIRINARGGAVGDSAGVTGQDFAPGGRFPQVQLGHTVIEFEPLAASQLMTQAGRSLVLGSIAGALLTLAAVLFWRRSAAYAAAEREFEQRRRLSQLGELTAVMAHEIRNPLASLKGNAQLLAERLTAGSREKAKADRVVAEASRLESLTSDLLEFARSGPIERQLVDPVEVARRALLELGMDAEVDASEAPQSWWLDPVRLRYALVNVLQNAAQASPDATPVLRIARADDSLVVEVRDFGSGITPGTEDRLFDPFFTTRTNGTGLGLSVARRAAEFHGGTITARNHPDGGAVFRIVLPPAPS